MNDPNSFLRFVSEHLPGTEVDGTVDEYASHGAFVDVDGLRAYVPLTAMGDPAPTSAREVLRKGDTRRFVVQAFDTPRRGVELALPEFVHVSGAPTDETVEVSIREGTTATRRRRRQRKAAKERAGETAPAAKPTAKKPTKRAAPAKAAATGKTAKKPAKRAPAKQSEKKAPVKAAGGERGKAAKSTKATKATKKAAPRKVAAKSAGASTAAKSTKTARRKKPAS